MDDGGVDVGGELWPRPTPKKPESTIHVENPNNENGCSHHKAASFAKEATAAAASAATAAAVAAKAAAKATAAAACNEGTLDDIQGDAQIEESNEENSSSPLEFRVVYPGKENQDEENLFQGASESVAKFPGALDYGMNFLGGKKIPDDERDSLGQSNFQRTLGDRVWNNQDVNFQDSGIYQDIHGSEVDGKNRVNSRDTSNSGGNPENNDTDMYPDYNSGNKVSSEKSRPFPDDSNSGVNAPKLNSKTLGDSGSYPRENLGVNSHGILGERNIQASTKVAPTQGGRNTQGTVGNVPGTSTPSGRNSQTKTNSSQVRADIYKTGVSSQSSSAKSSNSSMSNSQVPTKGSSQGNAGRMTSTTDNGKYSQISENSQKSGANFRETSSSGLNPNNDKVLVKHDGSSEKVTKISTSKNLNRQNNSSENDD